MLGPAGAAGAAGGLPRLTSTNGHNSAELWVSQVHPLTIVLSAPSTSSLAPVATSAMYKSMRVSRMLVYASRLPSGEKPISEMCASAGTVMLRSAPVAFVRTVTPVPIAAIRGPLFDGSMREPANPSHG